MLKKNNKQKKVKPNLSGEFILSKNKKNIKISQLKSIGISPPKNIENHVDVKHISLKERISLDKNDLLKLAKKINPTTQKKDINYIPFEKRIPLSNNHLLELAKKVNPTMNVPDISFKISKKYPPNKTSLALETIKSLGCKINEISTEELFYKYEQNGFIYPEKKKKLAPYLEKVRENWRKLSKSKKTLLTVLTSETSDKGVWASVCGWKELDSFWCCQHLVSSGNPVASRSVLLGFQKYLIDQSTSKKEEFVQNWFRPNNKYANKVFGSLQKTVGPKKSCLFEFCYSGVQLQSNLKTSRETIIKECTNEDISELTKFLADNRHSVFAKSGEFTKNNIHLESMNENYKAVGLFKRRHILLAYLNKVLVGAAIIYRSPIGLNFSFLENRCELIIKNQLPDNHLPTICESLLDQARNFYQNFEAPYIPVITDPHSATILTIMGHDIIRKYNQSIWSKDSYYDWYKNVDTIFSKVVEREKKKHLLTKLR